MRPRKLTEADIQAAWIKSLRDNRWIVIRLRAASEAGWPDVIAFRDGKPWFIEFKAPGAKPTPLQEIRHDTLRAQGIKVSVIDHMPK
jgi:Holliday junction resolvase